MKLYKWKKGDGITLLWMAVGALIGMILGITGVASDWPSIDDILMSAFFIVGFITFVGGIFKWIFRL